MRNADRTGLSWTLAAHDEFRCIARLEVRLGRELTRDDFDDAPLNVESWPRRSARLVDRLQRG